MTDRPKRLEQRGLVWRRPSDEVKRSMLVELTPKGRLLVERAWREDMGIESEIVAKLNSAEREQLASLLEQLARIMEREGPDSQG